MTNVTSPPQLSRSTSAPVVTAVVHAATEEWQDAVVSGGGQGDLVPLTVTFKTVLFAETCTSSSATAYPEKDQGGLEYQEKITLARHSPAIELDLIRDARASSSASFWVQVTALETPEDTEAREASEVTEFCSDVNGDERGQNKQGSQRTQRTSRRTTSNEFHMLAGWEALIRQISGSQKS